MVDRNVGIIDWYLTKYNQHIKNKLSKILKFSFCHFLRRYCRPRYIVRRRFGLRALRRARKIASVYSAVSKRKCSISTRPIEFKLQVEYFNFFLFPKQQTQLERGNFEQHLKEGKQSKTN